MKRLVLGLILLVSTGNAKWISVPEFQKLVGNGGKEMYDVRNKSFKLKFVAKIMEVEMTTDSGGNINGFAGNLKARIIKRIPQNTSVRCGEVLVFGYNQDVVDWKGAVSLAGKFQLKDCF